MEGEAARLFIPQSPTVDIHTRALERNAQKFLDSPQALIRSFLNNAIPEFPDLSIVDDALGSSIFTNDYVVKDMLNNLEGHAHNDSEDLSSNNSSLVLSLPESFELAPVTTIASKRPLMAKMSADLLELEYKQLVQTILSALPKEHCPRQVVSISLSNTLIYPNSSDYFYIDVEKLCLK